MCLGLLLQHCCGCVSVPLAVPDKLTRDQLIGGSSGEAQRGGRRGEVEEKWRKGRWWEMSGIMHCLHIYWLCLLYGISVCSSENEML